MFTVSDKAKTQELVQVNGRAFSVLSKDLLLGQAMPHTPQSKIAVLQSKAELSPIQAQSHGRHGIGNGINVIGLEGANTRHVV